jgi:hypothetical protein
MSTSQPKLFINEALLRWKGSNSDSICKDILNYPNVSYETKLMILNYLQTGEIFNELLNINTLSELDYLSCDELIEKILAIDKKILAKKKVISHEDIMMHYAIQNQNKLVFDSYDTYRKFTKTYDEKLILEKDGNIGFIHGFSKFSRNNNLLSLLLENSEINPNLKNYVGNTPLIISSDNTNTSSSEDTVRILLKHSETDINSQNIEGWTALMYAARSTLTSSTENTVRMLLEQPEIDPNLHSRAGNSALLLISDYSVTESSLNTYNILFQHTKTNINLQNNDGHL